MTTKKKLLIGLASLVGLFVLFYVIMFSPVGWFSIAHWELPPIQIKVSNLTVSPIKVEPGENVSITVDVYNVGAGKARSYGLCLLVNGAYEQCKYLNLNVGENATISFSVKRDIEGSYSVKLEGLSGAFQVVESLGPETLTVHLIDNSFTSNTITLSG